MGNVLKGDFMTEFRFEGSKAFFDYQGVGNKTNSTFMGEFCVKCVLSPLDYLRADRLYRELLGSTSPHLASKDAQNYSFALSQLKYRVIESPPFFKNKELDGGHLDANVLVDLINLTIDAEAEYKRRQDAKIKEMQDILAKRIKNKDIEKEEERHEDDDNVVPDEELPEVDLE